MIDILFIAMDWFWGAMGDPRFTPISLTISGAVYKLLKTAKAKKDKQYERIKERGISKQIQHLSSVSFTGMSGIVDAEKGRKTHVRVLVEETNLSLELGAYLGTFIKERKNVFFKEMVNTIRDHVETDEKMYKRRDWPNYVSLIGEELHDEAYTLLGKKIGKCKLLDELFETSLNVLVFQESFRKIIYQIRVHKGWEKDANIRKES